MEYLVLQRFEGLHRRDRVRLDAGAIVDDLQYDIEALRNGGVALIEYDAATMGDAVETFLSAINKESRLESIVPYLMSLGLIGGKPPVMLKAQALAQAEGNHSLGGLADKMEIKTLFVNTVARSWSMTFYSSADYVSEPIFVIERRAGNASIHWDTPYEDIDGSASLHYNFTDHIGTNTHDILVFGVELS